MNYVLEGKAKTDTEPIIRKQGRSNPRRGGTEGKITEEATSGIGPAVDAVTFSQ